MSRNIFVNSSLWNCSGEEATAFLEYCKKNVKNPKIEFDEAGDLIINEDFDRRHTTALLKFVRERK